MNLRNPVICDSDKKIAMGFKPIAIFFDRLRLRSLFLVLWFSFDSCIDRSA